MLKRLKALIPERHKGPMRAALGPSTDPRLEAYRGKKKVVVALAGFYQNLGDMALTYSQKRFIEATLPDHEVLLVPSLDSYRRMKALRSVVGPRDIVTTIAGGNMDDIYTSLEDCRRYYVKTFADQPFISFPQTIAFSDTPSGSKALRRSARTYGRHKSLTLFAREPESLSRMRAAFSNPIGYVPDIVLSLQLDNPPTERTGVFICIRDDAEAKLTPTERRTVRDTVLADHPEATIGDTVDVDLADCTPERYEGALEQFWDMLRHQRVVITDRLHCMIFCAITKTPCVVLPNSNHKIKGVYEAWLSKVPYIRYMNQFDVRDLRSTITDMLDLDLAATDVVNLSADFEPLREALRKAATSA